MPCASNRQCSSRMKMVEEMEPWSATTYWCLYKGDELTRGMIVYSYSEGCAKPKLAIANLH